MSDHQNHPIVMHTVKFQLTIGSEVVEVAPAPDEPPAPVDGLLVVDGLLRVEEVVEQRVEVLRRLGGLRLGRVALRLHVGRSPPLPLTDQHLGVRHGWWRLRLPVRGGDLYKQRCRIYYI